VLIADFFLFNMSLSALSHGGSSIMRWRSLMLASTVPRALLPLTTVYTAVRSFVPAACLLVVIFPLLGGTVGPGVLVLPLLFTLQVLMNIGIALLVSSFVVLVPDARNIMTYVNRVVLFATPVIYPVRLLPAAALAALRWQPLFAVFASYQAILEGGMPSPGMVALTVLWAGTLLVLGARVFLRREREFALHL
jgi:teichoic acid transport system permease protein